VRAGIAAVAVLLAWCGPRLAVAAAGSGGPSLLGYRYVAPPASGGQARFEVDAADRNGQVVGVRLSGDLLLIADGGCNLGGRNNGDPAHFVIPVRTLGDGEHVITIVLSSSTCSRRARVEQATHTVTLHLPQDAGTETHPRCDSPTTKRLVRSFARAVSIGDLDRADRAFAREPAFQWYSTTAPARRLRAAAFDRASLRAYFRRRLARHERLRVARLEANYEQRRDIGNFHGTLVRSADDMKPATYRFKGAASCARGRARLIVWSMAAGP